MDVIEPIKHIQKNYKAKYFAMGCSMGGNILANALGSKHNLNLESAVCFQAPTKIWKCFENVQNCLYGIFDWCLGNNMRKQLIRHAQDPAIVQGLKEEYGIDVMEYINSTPSMFKYDTLVTVPMFGYKSREEYYDKSSSCWSIPYIKTPTLFLAALDDPLIGKTGIDFQAIS